MSLVIIGLLGGLITGISPCILPVLPVIFLTGRRAVGDASTATPPAPASRWRPYLVIAGLVTSFTLVTLVGSLVARRAGPAAGHHPLGRASPCSCSSASGCIVPRFEQLLEKPFQRLARRSEVTNKGSGYGVGLALGAVFVPCAGPGARRDHRRRIDRAHRHRHGAAHGLVRHRRRRSRSCSSRSPAVALVERIRAFRTHERGLRIAAGIAMLALAVGLVFNVPQLLQRLVPDYTAGIQRDLTDNPDARRALDLGGLVTDENQDLDKCTNGAAELESCGTAPSIRGIEQWLNTPDGEAVDLADLRGEVVLIDFWAYSCINCQRSIPHVVAWDAAYRDAGLRVIGVHSPEYAFEKDAANVAAGARGLRHHLSGRARQQPRRPGRTTATATGPRTI